MTHADRVKEAESAILSCGLDYVRARRAHRKTRRAHFELEVAANRYSELLAATCPECEGHGNSEVITVAGDRDFVSYATCPANCDNGRRRDK